jgi:isopentenyl phosphate kinase
MVLKILKIGGSVFTHKTGTAKLNKTMVQSAALDIARWLSEDRERRLIFTTGGGSFGHPLAIHYRLNEATLEKSDEGFLRTTVAMRSLANKVCLIFHQHSVPLYPITTSNIFITNQGRIKSACLETLTKALQCGLVPFLSGDVTYDSEHTYRILSADQINTYLYQRLEVDVMLFGSNVDGIYWDDPTDNPQAELIPLVNPENYDQVQQILSSSPSRMLHGLCWASWKRSILINGLFKP